MRSFITSVLYLPIVLCNAMICLLIFDKLTVSLSISVICPIPALAAASATKPPTPPTPKRAILLFASFSTALPPISISVLIN